ALATKSPEPTWKASTVTPSRRVPVAGQFADTAPETAPGSTEHRVMPSASDQSAPSLRVLSNLAPKQQEPSEVEKCVDKAVPAAKLRHGLPDAISTLSDPTLFRPGAGPELPPNPT